MMNKNDLAAYAVGSLAIALSAALLVGCDRPKSSSNPVSQPAVSDAVARVLGTMPSVSAPTIGRDASATSEMTTLVLHVTNPNKDVDLTNLRITKASLGKVAPQEALPLNLDKLAAGKTQDLVLHYRGVKWARSGEMPYTRYSTGLDIDTSYKAAINGGTQQGSEDVTGAPVELDKASTQRLEEGQPVPATRPAATGR